MSALLQYRGNNFLTRPAFVFTSALSHKKLFGPHNGNVPWIAPPSMGFLPLPLLQSLHNVVTELRYPVPSQLTLVKMNRSPSLGLEPACFLTFQLTLKNALHTAWISPPAALQFLFWRGLTPAYPRTGGNLSRWFPHFWLAAPAITSLAKINHIVHLVGKLRLN